MSSVGKKRSGRRQLGSGQAAAAGLQTRAFRLLAVSGAAPGLQATPWNSREEGHVHGLRPTWGRKSSGGKRRSWSHAPFTLTKINIYEQSMWQKAVFSDITRKQVEI